MIRPINIENSKLYELLKDPIIDRLMTDAVTLNPCGHVFCEETVLNLEVPARCPLDRWLITSFSANTIVRNLAQEMESTTQTQNSNDLESSCASKGLSEEDAKVLFFEAATKGLADQLELFIDRGIQVDVVNDFGWTALLFATCRGHLLAVKILLARGANPNTVDAFNATALMWAARNNFQEILIALLDAHALINAVDEDGRTPLMLAARAGNLECVLILLDRGADASIETKNSTKAIDLARGKNHNEVVALLQPRG